MNREKLLWYANRLRSMPPQEIVHRVHEAVAMRQPLPEVPCSRPTWQMNSTNTNIKLVDVKERFWSHRVAEHCRERAVEAIGGSISVLGRTWSTSNRQWNVDPTSGYEWPAVPAHRLDYRHISGADPKWVWEVNRLLFLIPIAFAIEAGLTNRPKAEPFVLATLSDWIASCRPGTGPQWSASIEVAMRSIAMTIAIQSISEPGDETLRVIGQSVAEHAAWIKRFPSVYSSANNHRVAELAALLLLQSSWSEILQEDEQVAAERELVVVSEALFALDGIGLEQSPTYAAFSIEFLSLTLLCHTWRSEQSRQKVAQVVLRASNALAEFTNEDGTFILWGDNDEGKVVTVACPDSDYAASVVRLATGKETERSLGLSTFVDGGMSIIRDVEGDLETTWSFDHGPLGFGDLAAHGHADVLSVALRSGGADWIVDGGTYRYHGDKSWRTYFRSSRSHNAPQLDGLDSSVMTGDFNWHPTKRAMGKLISYGGDRVKWDIEATHDGYEKQGLGSVTRTLQRLTPGHYRITDSHDGGQRLSTAFILHPDCAVVRTDTGWLISRDSNPLTIEMTVLGQSAVRTECPEDESAWFSPTFGQKSPTWRLYSEAGGGAGEPQKLTFDFRFAISSYPEASH